MTKTIIVTQVPDAPSTTPTQSIARDKLLAITQPAGVPDREVDYVLAALNAAIDLRNMLYNTDAIASYAMFMKPGAAVEFKQLADDLRETAARMKAVAAAYFALRDAEKEAAND